MAPKPNQNSNAIVTGISVVVMLFLIHGGWDMIRDYIRSKQPHDMLATLHYHGEWSVGEYRECDSINLKDDEEPDVVCADAALSPSKIFKIRFSGAPIYDTKVKDGGLLEWLCRRDNADVTFSCVRKPTPEEPQPSAAPAPVPSVQHELSKDDLDNLRKRNECEQRFYDKKLYQVNGMSIGEACKQNSDLKP